MTFSIILLVASMAAMGSQAAPAVKSRAGADTGQELRKLTERRFAANLENDRSFYEQLLAPNFVILPGNDAPLSKTAYLDREFPKGRETSRRLNAVVTDVTVRIDEDSAVVSYRVAEPTAIGDQRFEARSTRVDTYVRKGGAWRLLSMAAADVATWPDAAAVDPRLLDEYAGTYQMSLGYLIVVTHEAGRLMAEVTGQSKVELFAENATTFFDRTDSVFARTVFERDTSGKVVAQVYLAQGQRIRALKIR